MADPLPLIDAQNILISSANIMPSEEIEITDSIDRILAEDVFALRTQPAGNMSAMDGYAISDDNGDTLSWEVVAECKAGSPPYNKISSAQCARIFTGALLPEGANIVIIQENIDRQDNIATLKEGSKISKGQHIRLKGSDFQKGDKIASSGTSITPALIGQLIAAGYDKIDVCTKPKIAIISTGDELRPAGAPCKAYEIPSSNGPMIAAMLAALPCEVVYCDTIKDSQTHIETSILSQQSCDIIITIGGASVGDHDLIYPTLKQIGAKIDFMKVAIKPGKPIMLAQLGSTKILGLPGNPASAFVTATLFLLPLVRKMCGYRLSLPHIKQGITTCNLPATGGRSEFLRARRQDSKLSAFVGQDSARMSTLSVANALIIRDSHSQSCHTGDSVGYIDI